MRIRLATLADVPRIAEIHVDSWHAAYRGLLPGEFISALTTEKREALWKLALESDEQVLLAETEDGRIVGFANPGPARDDAMEGATELRAIYLDPAFYGQGIGTLLWDTVARQVGSGTVYLWVLQSNARARSFYEKHGFRPDRVARNFEIAGRRFAEVRYSQML